MGLTRGAGRRHGADDVENIQLCGRLGGQALRMQDKRGFVIRMMCEALGSSRRFYVDHRGLDRNEAGDEDSEIA